MAKDTTYIFIDEFGTEALNNKAGNSSHFIYVAISINESEIEIAREIRNYISKKFNQNNDIHASSSIGNNDDKRIEILKELKKLKYRAYILVVDKKALYKDNGLKYKNIFIKFFQKIFIRKISNNIKNYSICFDKIGYKDFQISLKNFIDNKVIMTNDLFNTVNCEYRMEDDKNEKLLQIADIIANTCGKIFSDSHKSEKRIEFYDEIKSNISVIYFPEVYVNNYDILDTKEDIKCNDDIIDCALFSIKNFKENVKNDMYKDSEKIKVSLDILDYFYTEFCINKYRIVKTYELANCINIQERYSTNYNNYEIRKIIQFIRDEGVLIVSPLNCKGYKIPINENEIKESFNRIISNVEPMLKRVKIANDKISNYTSNKINILNGEVENFPILKKLVDVIDKTKI